MALTCCGCRSPTMQPSTSKGSSPAHGLDHDSSKMTCGEYWAMYTRRIRSVRFGHTSVPRASISTSALAMARGAAAQEVEVVVCDQPRQHK